MKTYVLTVSRTFPTTHKRKGEPTFFPEMILSALGKHELLTSTCFQKPPEKIHTIRSNYELWAKRIKEVQEYEATISIRYWSGKPYNSKQVEFCKLDSYSDIGISKLLYSKDHPFFDWYIPVSNHIQVGIDYHTLAKNDGLSLDDFKEWFRKYDLSKPMAIIHFTQFRY